MSPAQRTHPTDAASVRRLAVTADADPRTVLRELRKPGSVRGMAGQRIRAALQAFSTSSPVSGERPLPKSSESTREARAGVNGEGAIVGSLEAPPVDDEDVANDLALRRELTRVMRGESCDGTPPTLAQRIAACRELELADAKDVVTGAARSESK